MERSSVKRAAMLRERGMFTAPLRSRLVHVQVSLLAKHFPRQLGDGDLLYSLICITNP